MDSTSKSSLKNVGIPPIGCNQGTQNFNSRQAGTSSGFRSNSQSKRDEFCIFSKPDKKEIFGYENEKLQDHILKLKKEVNIKSKEVNSLKVELNLLSIEDKKKLKVIEDILSGSGKSFDEVVMILDGQSKVEKIDLSANSVIKLREIYVINFLKSQVGQLKALINERDEEIQKLKANVKVIKYTQLENELKIVQAECEELNKQNQQFNLKNEELGKGLKDLQYEHQMLYKKFLKKDRDIERSNNALMKMEEDNKLLILDKKKAEEISNKYKISMINMKADLKYKSDIANNCKSFEEEKEKLEKEKDGLSKRLDDMTRERNKLKIEIK